ncbi:unnamed protein product [Heligmosomoides polygyrus]|uniref:C2H2-type domain-containing protein n=1 Tax=Heligmosomoides polygyrus TaxID=6339 RepID=A0A183F439_HELPZ|nr:unnamed protein product [Heligmosomoides polygyrus]
MLRQSLYKNLRFFHGYTEEQLELEKERLRGRATNWENISVVCPKLCETQFMNHEGLAIHCQEHHSEYGACGEEQNYSLHSLTFKTQEDFEWLKTYSRRGISIDDTHNATKYPMKLATVVVADDLDRGLPAAFLLSGTMTAADVQKLFMEIKKLLPEFNLKYIVTDEAPCFFNGYKAVFPLSSTQLRYCRWHVSKTWSEL